MNNLEAGTFKSLAEIHKYLFDLIYDFAGQIRTVNIAKGNFRFAPLMYLQVALENIEKMPQSTYDEIIENALSWSVAIIDKQDIDELNILNATKKGVTEAIKGLETKPELILVDALNGIDTCNIKYDSIIKGDAKCYSISAASILAKVTRDRIMREWDEIYPQYGFAKNKGYGTKMHIEALKEYGPCPIHRKTFIKHFVD